MRGFIQVTESTVPETYTVKAVHSDLNRERTVTINETSTSVPFETDADTSIANIVFDATGITVGDSDELPEGDFKYYRPLFVGYGVNAEGTGVGITVYEDLEAE